MFSSLIVKCSVVFMTLLILSKASVAKQCSDVVTHLSPNEPRSRLQLTKELATSLHMSVVAELAYSRGKQVVMPPPAGSTLADFAIRLGLDGSVQCLVNENVIHIYDPIALNASNNALNYTFEDFQVPDIADLFIIRFKTRLINEAYRPAALGPVSGSDTGATSNDAEMYPLVPEHLRHIQARSLLMREFSAVPMIFAVEVRTGSTQDKRAAWAATISQGSFAVLR